MRAAPSTRPRGSRGRRSSAFVCKRHAHIDARSRPRCSSRPAVSCQPQPPRGSHGPHIEDVRQRALALQLAAAEVEALGFWYICTMNSDMVPDEAFQEEFEFESFVRLRLTD